MGCFALVLARQTLTSKNFPLTKGLSDDLRVPLVYISCGEDASRKEKSARALSISRDSRESQHKFLNG